MIPNMKSPNSWFYKYRVVKFNICLYTIFKILKLKVEAAEEAQIESKEATTAAPGYTGCATAAKACD
jgi:hypothetical protein